MPIGFHIDDDELHYDDDHCIGVCFDSDYNQALAEMNHDALLKAVREMYTSIKMKAEEYHTMSKAEYLPAARMLLDRRACGLLQASEIIEEMLRKNGLSGVIR